MIIESPSAIAGVHIAEKLGIPYFAAFPFPWYQTSVYADPLVAPKKRSGALYNLWTYKVIEHIFRNFYTPYINSWRTKTLELVRLKKQLKHCDQLRFTLLFAPAFFSR
jgi:sterol 3beta-glucosyltransferase